MSPTNVTTEVATKKSHKPPHKDPEWKKAILRDSDTKSIESTNRSIQGAGETPAPPKPTKPRRPREKKPADSLPKKNAQRAKGSIALNKTIEQQDAEPKAEKRCQALAEKLAKADGASLDKAVEGKTQRRRKKQQQPPPREAGEKPERKTAAKRKPSVAQPESFESIEEKTLEVVDQEPVEVKSDEIRAVATGFNSCSFFEKIQQGVKAYFSSRTINPEDRNKKEGGIQTRGRVGKGGEEEIAKTGPGMIINNNSACEHTLRYLGGHSSNFLSTKPKLLRHFRKMKRKQLYRPKKCNVRIQIPRKGYFYRSTVELQGPEHATQPRAKTKVDPKSQISGLAPVRAKGIRLPDKKELKKQDPPAAQPLDNHPSDPFTPKYAEWPPFDGKLSDVNLEKKVEEYLALNWPDTWPDISFEDSQPEGERQESGDEEETKPEFPWLELVDSFNSALRRDQIIYNLEFTPMTGGVTPFRENVLQSIEEENEIGEPEQSVHKVVTASLMDGIDLHLELENYLKAIEGFQTTKKKTKNTLQCNFYDNYVPLKLYSSSPDLQKREEEYFDVAENRSGNSFDSAISDCPQLEEVRNKMLLNVTATTGPEPRVRRGNKPEANTGREQQQEQKLKNSVKRAAGISAFRAFRLDDKTTWGPTYLQEECKKHPGDLLYDGYEKIQPHCAASIGRETKSSCLLQNSETQFEQPPHCESNAELSNPLQQQWSPTLQELIEIYNSVLKQYTQMRRSSKESMSRCFSTHLLPFLNEKLLEKHYKADLLNLAKEFRMDCKAIAKLGNPIKSNNDLLKLEEYVGMFQEILHSSLSIHQITRLNNILAGLQDYSEKNYNYMKDLKDDADKLAKSAESVEMRTSFPKVAPKPKTPPRKPKKSAKFETSQKPQQRKTKKRKPKSKPVKTPPKEKIQKTELPALEELESLLKLCSENGIPNEEDTPEEKKKLLVKVKLQGNQVLVSEFSCFNSESALMSEKPEPKGTSELIIENVTKNKISSDLWWKNTKSSRLRIQNQENKRKRPKKPKSPATKGRKRQMRPKPKESKLPLVKREFEYDQMLLREQHPIEAIAEISESKVSQVENSEGEQWKGEPPPETKILQDISVSPTAMKEALKAVLEKKVFSKDLLRDFGWSEEELGKTVPRKTTKRRPAPKKNTHAVMVRSMVDLKKRQTPTNTKGRKVPRHGCPCLCYSLLQSGQGKASKKTQGQTNRSGPVASKQKPKVKEVCCKVSKEAHLKMKPTLTSSKSEPSSSVLCTTPEKDGKPVDELEFIPEDNPEVEQTADDSQTTASVESFASVQTTASVQKKEDPSRTQKESSVALLPPSACNDCISFLAEMIHSDSFLSNIPPHAVSHSKLKALFKCNSDLKFYPGRLSEGGTAEEQPIVTFVLTPSQHEIAQLPEKQVKIVKRNESKAPSAEDEKDQEIPAPDIEEGMSEIRLKSIEEFINYLSKCRKLAARRKKQSKPQTGENKIESSSPNFCPQNKTPDTKPLSGLSLPSCQEAFHECQKRKPPEVIKKKSEKLEASVTNKPRPRQEKRLENSDVFLSKMVDNLSRALENLQKEKLTRKEGSEKVVQAAEKLETDSEPKLDSLTEKTVDPVVVEAVTAAINQAEGLGEKKEIFAEIGDGLCRTTQNVGTTCEEVPKKLKSLKIRIHCNEPKRPLESGEVVLRHPNQQAGEIELLDSLVSRDTQGGDLKRQNSTYFDAVERIPEAKMCGDTNTTFQPTAEGKLDLSLEFGVTEQPKHTPFTPSDERLPSKEVLGENSEDAVFNKIGNSFKEGEVEYSMALLEDFLSKSDDSNCGRLRELLALIETRSRNIMMNMERAAWQKVLSLLEEASQVLEKDDQQDSVKPTAKLFMDKIQLLNRRRLVDLQNFCSSFMNPPQEEDKGGRNVLDRIKQSLKLLKQKFTLKRDDSSRNLENLDRSDLSTSGSGFKIHSTVSLPEIREDHLANANYMVDPKELKTKLQQRFLCMQELLTAADKNESENLSEEIQEVMNRVAKKMKTLEKVLEDHGAEEASSTCWRKATSLLRVAKGCRREEGGSAEARLDRRPGYVNLMKCLMKAWDTRMTIGSITSECFS